MSSRHLVNHNNVCASCGELHIIVIDLEPLMAEVNRELKAVHTELRKMGRLMATATEQLTALNAKVDDLVADFHAFRDAVNTDTFSAEAQTAFDSLSAKIGGLDTEVGDADGSDTPV